MPFPHSAFNPIPLYPIPSHPYTTAPFETALGG